MAYETKAWLATLLGDFRSLSANGFGQCSFDGPAKLTDSLFKEAVRKASFFRPLYEGFRVTPPGDEPVASLVSRLLFRRCPPAVFWAVTSVVVDTVKRLSGWPRAHVGQEVFKGLQPAIADRDASASVIAITLASRIRAPFQNALPRFVLCGFCMTARGTVFKARVPASSLLASQTTARFRGSLPQATNVNNRFASAIANAVPCRIPPFLLSRWRNGDETAEAVASTNSASHQRTSHQRSSEMNLGRTVMSRLFGDQPSRVVKYTPSFTGVSRWVSM